MKTWFVWNDQNSDALGLWVSKLPKITRAKERYETVDIPGRAGSLTLLEGQDVYSSYVKEITVQTVNWNPNLQNILQWLRGSGVLIVCNEIDRVYTGRIVSEVAFERIGNNLLQAKIQIQVDPFKRSRFPEKETVTITGASGSVSNIGDVACKPIVSITGGGTNTITIAGQAMTFTDVSGTIKVDCDANIITQGSSIWTGSFTGDFWRIPKGLQNVTQTSNASIVIAPNWRWV